MRCHGWGRYPVTDARIFAPRSFDETSSLLSTRPGASLIARGLGRSYGDSSLAETILQTRHLDNFLKFDEQRGLLTCGGGLSLSAILDVIVPRGWFLPVVPGTRFVSVGGAIASDVHGKNHHVDGSFSAHVVSLQLVLASGEVMLCSRETNAELFKATCGGMGLTGIIAEAVIKLRRTDNSTIVQKATRAENLQQIFELFENAAQAHYSVAWLDCMARGNSLGRSLLYTGEHNAAKNGDVGEPDERVPALPGPGLRLNIPLSMPAALLNSYVMRVFNNCYYALGSRRASGSVAPRPISYDSYFFPLDGISNWNRLYGRKGFVQYQFVIPEESAFEGVHEILQVVSTARKGSFLSVLKKFGPANDNYLSFPQAGYTLALDFKLDSTLFRLLDELDQVVLAHGGRLYLAKDSRMSEQTFKRSYPNWETFAEIREQVGASSRFNSLQSKRLGL